MAIRGSWIPCKPPFMPRPVAQLPAEPGESGDVSSSNSDCWRLRRIGTENLAVKLIFYSLGMPSARKLLISLRAVVEYFKM
jgi:hypothetical protein